MNARLSRRLLLTGGGVSLALPFLPSALWSRRAGAASCQPPRRFMAWYAPNGMSMPDWTPSTTGTGWVAPAILAPLAPIRNKILVVTGLDHQDLAVPGNPPGADGAGTGCFLNMIPVYGHEADGARTSIDQVLLPVLNDAACGAPLVESLQLGVQGPNGLCDGTVCDFSRTISWRGGVAMPIIYDPQQCFDQLFGSGSADAAQRALDRSSILDSVLADAQSLSIKLSPADRLKLDEHTTRIRNLETRLQRLGKSALSDSGGPNGPSGVACMPPPRPEASPPLNFDRGITPPEIIETHVPLFLDLMAAAFECDVTRAITFMLGNGTSNNNYSFLFNGQAAPHHGIANTDGDPVRLAKITTIDTWEIAQASALLQRLDSVIEADGGSILDHTTFYLSSDVADGQVHNIWDMPVLVAGGASGALKIDGRHINYIPDMPFPRPYVGPRSSVQTGRVFISMLRAHGIIADSFGLATGGPLPELMP